MYCIILLFSLINFTLIDCNFTTPKSEFELHVIHINDFHARFEETSLDGDTCKQNCIGGFSRIYTAVHNQLKQYPNSIVLNAGDNFQGTVWYNIFKWTAVQHFLNKLPIDVYTLGNHEFDDKIEGVIPFIKNLKAPTVVANIDDSKHLNIQGLYNKSVVINRDGRKIGIVGVLLSTTDKLSHTENLKFFDESESVNKEAEILVAEEDVDTIIVLSHCGYDVEKYIARNAAPKIGLIVGGHSHSFLYTGNKTPNGKVAEGPYPTVVQHEDGRKILIVQASAYSEFVGDISVTYNSKGDVVSWSGAPIYLDESIAQDEEINKELTMWKRKLNIVTDKVIGYSNVLLDRFTCTFGECNLGNFVADAMIHAYLQTDEDNAWTQSSIAVINTGIMRSSIQPGNVTVSDLITTVPFEDTIDIGEIQGRFIKEFLEVTTKPFNNKVIKADFSFLQISGLRVIYNMTNPIGSRVYSVKVRCRECLIPMYEPLDPNRYYRIVINSYTANGGDGFDVVANNLINHTVGKSIHDLLQEYLIHETPIITSVEGRIEFIS